MDVQDYLKDPLSADAPIDIEALAEMFGEKGETDGTPAVKEASAAPAPAAKVEPAPKVEEKAKEEPEAETPILTPDGKNQIPFAVLKAERARSTELARRVAELEAKAAPITPAEPAVDTELNDALQRVSEESPELGKLFAATLKGNSTKDAQIAALTREVQKLSTAGQFVGKAIETEVNEAISNIPKLAYVASQSTPELKAVYADLTTFDNMLQADPKFADLPLKERFSKAVAMYEAAHGAIELPVSAKPVVDPQAAASKVIAAVKAVPPATLSDLPGGAMPEAGFAETAMNLSADQLTQKFMSMTEDQVQAALARM